MRRMPTLPSRKSQSGFIQNLIIPGIILIGIVIAGFASLSGGSGSTNTSNEQASMTANAVLTQSMTLATAISRAEGDGTIINVVAPTDIALSTLVTAGYVTGSLPSAPPNAQSVVTAWEYAKASAPAKDAAAVPANLGSAAGDDILYLDKLTDAVCRRINNKLYTTGTTAAAVGTFTIAAGVPTVVTNAQGNVLDANRQTGAAEGCLANSGGGFTYYKVLNIR